MYLCHLFSTFDPGRCTPWPTAVSSPWQLLLVLCQLLFTFPEAAWLEVTHRYTVEQTQPFPVPNGRRNFTKITLVSAAGPIRLSRRSFQPELHEFARGWGHASLQQLSQKNTYQKTIYHIRTKLVVLQNWTFKIIGASKPDTNCPISKYPKLWWSSKRRSIFIALRKWFLFQIQWKIRKAFGQRCSDLEMNLVQ